MENSQTSYEIKSQVLSNTSITQIEISNNEESNKSSKKLKQSQSYRINKLYQSLYELYSQKQFKKIVKSIKLKSDKVDKFFFNEWKLLHIRTTTLQKILYDKISKYHNSIKIPHFSNYLEIANNDINNWILLTKELFIQNDKNYVGAFNEFIITFILKNCLILSKKYINSGHIKNAIEALSLGLKFIISSIVYFASPDSYYLSAEILLYFSSLMIAEKKFQTAMNLISLSIKFSYISIEIKLMKDLNNYHTLFDLNNYKNEIKILSKIFFNLSTAFYQLSVCQENQKDCYNAYFSMKASKYFSKFINFENMDIYQNLIKSIENRLLMRNRIIIFFEKCVRKEELEHKSNKKRSQIKMMISHEEKKKQKYDKIQRYAEHLKFIDVDDEEPDLFHRVGEEKKIKQNVLKLTKHMQLLNYLMNDEFKDLVHSMKKIEINKIDKETVYKISKRIIKFKNREHFKLEQKIKKQINIKRKLEERKNSVYLAKNEQEDSNEKITKNKNLNNSNKSNTLKSTTLFSMSKTTMNKKKQRVHSAFIRVNPKNLAQDTNKKNTSKVLTFRNNSSKKMTFYNSNLSLYSTPSGYFSINDNNFSTNKNQTIFDTKKYRGLSSSNSVNLKMILNKKNNQSATVKTTKKISIFKANNKNNVTARYNPDKIFLSKGFRRKYTFLEKQFDKEIDFHKNLLKIKNMKEDLVKPKAPNFREINQNAKNFFYMTYYNELSNVKDKQIFFDKKEVYKKNKISNIKRYESTKPKISKKLSLSKDIGFMDTEDIKEMNNKCIKKMTKSISEINNKKKYLKRMKY